jgi:suppressor for copper-sensitivity B
MTPTAVAARSGEFRLGVEFRLAHGWHAYWRNSGDAGFPPTFDLRQTPQLEAPRVLWPAPHRYTMPGDLVAFGYADEVIYPLVATLRPSKGDEGATVLPIVLAVDYLVCAVECVPYRYDLKLDQPLGDAAVADPDTAPRFESWVARAPAAIAAGRVGAEIERAGDDYELVVNVPGAAAAMATADFIPDSHELFELGPPRKSAANGLTFTVPLTLKDKTAKLPKSARFSWVLTGLDERALESTASAEIPGRRPPLAVTSTTTVAILLALVAARRRRARAARERAQTATSENNPRT